MSLLASVSPHAQSLQATFHVLSPKGPQAFMLSSPMDDLPKINTSTLIGIVVAISGNVLISLALNLQKLAHKRVEEDHRHHPPSRPTRAASLDENDEDLFLTRNDNHSTPTRSPVETQPLMPFPITSASGNRSYGTRTPRDPNGQQSEPESQKRKSNFLSGLLSHRSKPGDNDEQRRYAGGVVQNASVIPMDVTTDDFVQPGRRKSSPRRHALKVTSESDYLKSKLWWTGFLLMNVGELGNFISYAWAPASVVAPLGTFALISNCLFAPLLLRERFRKRDLLGILIAIIGAVTVVLSSNPSDTRLGPDALLKAISQVPFLVYSTIYVAGAICLATLSHGDVGNRWVFVDIGLCALFGGFTVLSTKAISTLLTMESIDMFGDWITYPVTVVLIGTGVGQIRYLNRALMRFDSKVVIPVQFVFFNLSAITGSAILYGDFKRAKFHEIITFLYGCAATFLGVFIIAWAPAGLDETLEEDLQEETDVETPPDHGSNGLDAPNSRFGSLSRRRRATLISPTGESSGLRSPPSGIGLIGLSPAQHLLLVHTPPREIPFPSSWRDGDREGENEHNVDVPDSRRRTMSWLDDDRPAGESPTKGSSVRDHSLGRRVRSSLHTVSQPHVHCGSADQS